MPEEVKHPQLNRLRSLLQKLLELDAHLADCIEQTNRTLHVASKLPLERVSAILQRENMALQNAKRNVVENIENTRRSLKYEYQLSVQRSEQAANNPSVPPMQKSLDA